MYRTGLHHILCSSVHHWRRTDSRWRPNRRYRWEVEGKFRTVSKASRSGNKLFKLFLYVPQLDIRSDSNGTHCTHRCTGQSHPRDSSTASMSKTSCRNYRKDNLREKLSRVFGSLPGLTSSCTFSLHDSSPAHEAAFLLKLITLEWPGILLPCFSLAVGTRMLECKVKLELRHCVHARFTVLWSAPWNLPISARFARVLYCSCLGFRQ